jgi:adenylylsulfate kinase-like enzyme
MQHELEIIVKGKQGAGKTTVAGILHRRLADLGFAVNLEDGELELPQVTEQVERSLKGGFGSRAKIHIRTELVGV